MSNYHGRNFLNTNLSRRTLLQYAAGTGLAAAGLSSPLLAAAQDSSTKTGVDPAIWTPEYITSIAGTLEVDTAAECAKVVPLDYTGKLTYWWVGPNQASPDIEHQINDEFWAAFAATYPNITIDKQNLDYNQMLDKIRTSALGGAAPAAAKMPILWGVEFAAKGQLIGVRPRIGWLHGRRVLAGRAEIGDLGWQDLRRADQQRNDGVDLECRAL